MTYRNGDRVVLIRRHNFGTYLPAGQRIAATRRGSQWVTDGASGWYTDQYVAENFDIEPVVDERVTEATDARVMRVAANLISEDGENPEYDRAISEMTCELIGAPMDSKDWVLRILRAMG